MNDFNQMVDQLKAKKNDNEDRRRSLSDQKLVIEGLDAVQNAVIQTTKYLLEALAEDTLKTEITNHISKIDTPDALKAGESVVEAVNKLRTVAEDKEVDLTPVLEQLNTLGELISRLPTENVEIPEYLDNIRVNNLAEVVECLENVEYKISKLEMSPNITVSPTPVTVEAPKVTVDLKELKEIKTAIEALSFPDANGVLLDLIAQTADVSNAVRSLEFPVPNFRTADIVDAVIGKGTALRVEVDTSNSPVIYFGKADPLAEKSEAVWQISKGDTTTGLSKIFPNGDSSFSFIWDDRATLTYNS